MSALEKINKDSNKVTNKATNNAGTILFNLEK
jgi:hypothetical protein